MSELSIEEIREAIDNFNGYCPDCEIIVDDETYEPDRTGGHCPECDGNRVMGIENAIIEGLLS